MSFVLVFLEAFLGKFRLFKGTASSKILLYQHQKERKRLLEVLVQPSPDQLQHSPKHHIPTTVFQNLTPRAYCTLMPTPSFQVTWDICKLTSFTSQSALNMSHTVNSQGSCHPMKLFLFSWPEMSRSGVFFKLGHSGVCTDLYLLGIM